MGQNLNKKVLKNKKNKNKALIESRRCMCTSSGLN